MFPLFSFRPFIFLGLPACCLLPSPFRPFAPSPFCPFLACLPVACCLLLAAFALSPFRPFFCFFPVNLYFLLFRGKIFLADSVFDPKIPFKLSLFFYL
jgi:hypothetical protein